MGITVNTDTTVVMVCKKSNRPENIDLFYCQYRLILVTKFTYLGVTLSANVSFLQAQKPLSKQALKAIFSLYTLFDSIYMDIAENLDLFDSMILHILNYGSEVWGFHKAPNIEKVHLKFMKTISCVRQQSSNLAIYDELGKVPLLVLRQISVIKYWYRILKTQDSLIYKLFNRG